MLLSHGFWGSARLRCDGISREAVVSWPAISDLSQENPVSTLRQLLQDADPLSREPQPPEAALERVRLRIRDTAPADPELRAGRARSTLVGALAMAIVAAVALGYQFWRHETTTLLAAVRFEVRLAEDHPVPGQVVAQVADSGPLIYLHPEAVVSNEDIARGWVSQDGSRGFGVTVEFLLSGAERLRRATTAHVGRPVAILIDGRVVMAPVVRSPIGDSALISGFLTQAEAERVARGIEIR